jgi:hypothetical protein
MAAQSDHHRRQIVVVGGGAADLELVNRLGRTPGKRGLAGVALVEQSPAHLRSRCCTRRRWRDRPGARRQMGKGT